MIDERGSARIRSVYHFPKPVRLSWALKEPRNHARRGVKLGHPGRKARASARRRRTNSIGAERSPPEEKALQLFRCGASFAHAAWPVLSRRTASMNFLPHNLDKLKALPPAHGDRAGHWICGNQGLRPTDQGWAHAPISWREAQDWS